MKTKMMYLLLFSLFPLLMQAQNATDITMRSADAIDISNMEMTSDIFIRDGKGNVRERTITTWSKSFAGGDKMLIRFLAPAEVKGTSLLIHDYDKQADQMWVYMPALRKVRRILSTEKGKSFMGSEFSNADMSKPNIDEFNYKVLGSEIVNGKNCWKVEAAGKTDAIKKENNYSRKISYIDQTNYLCLRIEYYDFSDKLQRVQTLDQYKKLANGKYFAYRMLMENVRNKRNSEMQVRELKLNSSLPESAFSPNQLEP